GFDAVAGAIAGKMERRHPHVFGTASERDAESQTATWEAIKAAERQRKGQELSVLGGISIAVAGRTPAGKLGKRAAGTGFDWDEVSGVLAKVREELAELEAEVEAAAPQARLEEEMGDLLFACANLARHLKVDPEAALRSANAKFERRFRRVEALLAEQGTSIADADMVQMEAAWQQAKQEEKARLERGSDR